MPPSPVFAKAVSPTCNPSEQDYLLRNARSVADYHYELKLAYAGAFYVCVRCV